MSDFSLKRNYTDLMFDLETLGADRSDVLIFEIAAIPFNLETGEYEDENYFHANINIQTALHEGFVITESTLLFWMKYISEHPEAYDFIAKASKTGEHPQNVMVELYNYITVMLDAQNIRIWSRGFDKDYIKHYMSIYGIQRPWDFRKERCVRTYCMDHEHIVNQTKRDGIEHTSVGDCIHQINYLNKVYNYKQILKKE